MNKILMLMVLALNAHTHAIAFGSDTSMRLTQAYCGKNQCNDKMAVIYAIRSALAGTCIMFSKSSNLKSFAGIEQSDKDWWIITKSDISAYEYQSTIAFAKKLSESTSKQVYLAEPTINLEGAITDFCISTYQDFKFNYQTTIGFIVPKQ